MAGGAVLGGLAATWVYSKYGPIKLVNNAPAVKNPATDGFILPGTIGANGQPTKYGPLFYSVSLPLLTAALTPMVLKGEAGRKLSTGMLYGAAVLLIQNVVNIVQTQVTAPAGTGAYVNGGRIRTIGAPQSAISPTGAYPLMQRSAFRGF